MFSSNTKTLAFLGIVALAVFGIFQMCHREPENIDQKVNDRAIALVQQLSPDPLMIISPDLSPVPDLDPGVIFNGHHVTSGNGFAGKGLVNAGDYGPKRDGQDELCFPLSGRKKVNIREFFWIIVDCDRVPDAATLTNNAVSFGGDTIAPSTVRFRLFEDNDSLGWDKIEYFVNDTVPRPDSLLRVDYRDYRYDTIEVNAVPVCHVAFLVEASFTARSAQAIYTLVFDALEHDPGFHNTDSSKERHFGTDSTDTRVNLECAGMIPTHTLQFYKCIEISGGHDGDHIAFVDIPICPADKE